MSQKCEIIVDLWADFAMFTRPESKVERATYPVPTPSALRGALNAIYCKPLEFHYEIRKIDIIQPGYEFSIKKNELKVVANRAKMKQGYNERIDVSKNHTPRTSTYLRNVYYRVYADIVLHDNVDSHVNIAGIKSQFNRRIECGKCFTQPYLGTRECMCFFGPPDFSKKPIEESCIFGIMLYDIFNPSNNIPLNTDKKNLNDCTNVSFFNACMVNGSIEVPSWNSGELYRKGV